MKTAIASLVLTIALCGMAMAQETPPPPGEPTIRVGPPMQNQFVARPTSPFMRIEGPGKWWKDSALMKKIGVSDEQVTKIEKIFLDHRLQLIDLHADLEKQEAILEPLVEADQPEEAKVVAQIDKVAQARANLEKSDALMLLAIRRVLTVDQWKKLGEVLSVDTFHARPTMRATTPGPAAPAPPAMPPPRE